MPYSRWDEDVWTDLTSAAVTVATTYGLGTWAKAKGEGLAPTIVGTILGVVGVGTKHIVDNRYGHEALEGLAGGGLGFLGAWLAANTKTLGGKAPGDIPLQNKHAHAAPTAFAWSPSPLSPSISFGAPPAPARVGALDAGYDSEFAY